MGSLGGLASGGQMTEVIGDVKYMISILIFS